MPFRSDAPKSPAPLPALNASYGTGQPGISANWQLRVGSNADHSMILGHAAGYGLLYKRPGATPAPFWQSGTCL